MPAKMTGPRRQNGSFYKKRPVYRKRAPKPSAGLTTLVKGIVKAQEETKYEQYHVLPDVLFNSQISGTADIYPVIPPIGNGQFSYQRAGDKITPTKCTVKMNLGFDSADNVARDITAHVFVLRSKTIKSARLVTSIPITSLLDMGGSGSVSFDGTLQHAQMPVEKTNFTVVSHKTVRLQKVLTQSGNVASQNSNTSRALSVNVKLPALKYDNSLDTTMPQNDYPFIVIGYTYNCPNQSPDTLSGSLRVEASTQMWYKDA